MHCPTCATELSPDGACPRCARPPLVPPTPVLAAGAVVTGGNEYPPGLPYSMAEIRQACDYLSLIGQLMPYSLIGIVTGAYILLFTIPFTLLAFSGAEWRLVPVFLLLGMMLIGRGVFIMLVPNPANLLIEGIIAMIIGALLVPTAAIFFFVLNPAGLIGLFPVYLAGLPMLFGYLQYRHYRRFAHLIGIRPAKAVTTLLRGWLKTLHRAKVKTEETVIHFRADGTIDGQTRTNRWRARVQGDYLLLAAMNSSFSTFTTEVHFLHRRDFAIRDGGPAYFGVFGRWRKAVFEIGATWTVKGTITEECFARYRRWRAADAGIGEPPASVG